MTSSGRMSGPRKGDKTRRYIATMHVSIHSILLNHVGIGGQREVYNVSEVYAMEEHLLTLQN